MKIDEKERQLDEQIEKELKEFITTRREDEKEKLERELVLAVICNKLMEKQEKNKCM